MKLSQFLAAGLVPALLVLGGLGCQTHKTTAPQGGGYEVVTHPYHTLMDDPPPPRLALQHRSADDSTTDVWPSLYTAKVIVRDDLALFIAEKAYITPDRVTYPRLFAVRAPELPLDLTDEVLWRWSRANGKPFSQTIDKFSSIMIEENNDKLVAHLQFWAAPAFGQEREDWPDDGTVVLDWHQVDELMRAVKTKGLPQKDIRWSSSYIGEKY